MKVRLQRPRTLRWYRMYSAATLTRRVLLSYVLSLMTWLVLAFVVAYQWHVLAETTDPYHKFRDALAIALIRYLVYALLTPPLFYLVHRFPINPLHFVSRTVFYSLGALVFVPCYSLLRWLVMPLRDESGRWLTRSVSTLLASGLNTFADQILMYLAIVAVAHAFQLFRRATQDEHEKLELREALAASDLHLLKTQLQPHMLFNTLNGISTLIDTDAKSAKGMIVQLSDLIRLAVEHGSSDMVPLRDEMKFVSGYLDLQKMRLGDRLQVSVSLEPGTLPILVPQLILQPLVENAIVHGVSCCREGGWIKIESTVHDGRLELRIINSIGGRSTPGTGFGIRSTYARLRYLFGDQAEFTFQRLDLATGEATLNIPILGLDLRENPGSNRKPMEVKVYDGFDR